MQKQILVPESESAETNVECKLIDSILAQVQAGSEQEIGVD